MSAHGMRDFDFAPRARLKWARKHQGAVCACELGTKGPVVTER